MNTPHPTDPLPLSLLNDFLYCERRAALKGIDGVRRANEHTLIGDLAHEAVDTPGYEHRAGWELLRALPVFSDQLGLSGKADLVEVQRDPVQGRILQARPVEYKKGPKRKFDNDDVQLCAQALCLEEMLGIPVTAGMVYHVTSQRRREVVFNPALRQSTLDTLTKLKALIASKAIPIAILKPLCDGCSLREVCMPESAHYQQTSLYEPRSL
ncbi:MAG: CRISPR-associated protein Cas4 [Verrucomicrobiota bacterium]|nr:CRISPR-associated protein Cas4 [Verrucomicrobiota bacterium]